MGYHGTKHIHRKQDNTHYITHVCVFIVGSTKQYQNHSRIVIMKQIKKLMFCIKWISICCKDYQRDAVALCELPEVFIVRLFLKGRLISVCPFFVCVKQLVVLPT